MIWRQPRSFPPRRSVSRAHRGRRHRRCSRRYDLFVVVAVAWCCVGLVAAVPRHRLGLRMRAAAFAPEVVAAARRPGRRHADPGLGAGRAGRALAGVLVIADRASSAPAPRWTRVRLGFTAAVVGGLDSPVGAVVGGLIARAACSVLRQRLPRQRLDAARRCSCCCSRCCWSARRACSPAEREAGHERRRATVLRRARAAVLRRRCRATRPGRDRRRSRSYVLTYVLRARSATTSSPRGGLLLRHRRADRPDRAQRADLARARRVDGDRRVHARRCCSGRRLGPGRCAAGRCSPRRSSPAAVGVLVGAGRGPAARALPGGRHARGGGRGCPALATPRSTGRSTATRACRSPSTAAARRSARRSRSSGGRPGSPAAAALLALLLLANLDPQPLRPRRCGRSATTRWPRALAGIHVARTQVLAFVVSAACAGLGGGAARVVLAQSVSPGAFPLDAVAGLLTRWSSAGWAAWRARCWGALLLVAAADLRHRATSAIGASLDGDGRGQPRRSPSTASSSIVVMLARPGGIQGVLRRIWTDAAARNAIRVDSIRSPRRTEKDQMNSTWAHGPRIAPRQPCVLAAVRLQRSATAPAAAGARRPPRASPPPRSWSAAHRR